MWVRLADWIGLRMSSGECWRRCLSAVSRSQRTLVPQVSLDSLAREPDSTDRSPAVVQPAPELVIAAGGGQQPWHRVAPDAGGSIGRATSA